MMLGLFIAAFNPDMVFAAGEVSETGTAGMSFLRITPSASIASLGGVSSARWNGTSSIWSNPALATGEDNRSVEFTHIMWVDDIKQEYAAFLMKTTLGSFGMGMQVFDSGDIELRSANPSSEPDGTYSIKNAAFTLTYARTIVHGISFGVTGKKLFEKVSMETAGGYAFDAGLTAETPLDGLRFAVAFRNYGRMDKLRNDRTKLPSDIVAGFAYATTAPYFAKPLGLSGDFVRPKYGDTGFRLGAELEVIPRFFLRTGYRSDSDIEGLSFGIGLNYQIFAFDVAYTPMKEGFDNTMRFTLGLTEF
jgi:hypothetical protein